MGLPFDYELGEAGFEVRLGPWVVRRLPYGDIDSVDEGYDFWNEHWTNVWPMRFLTIRLRGGVFKNFVINPPDGEGFASRLRTRLPGAAAS